MERKQVISRLGTGTRVLIVRSYWRRGDPDRYVRMRLQVWRRTWGWRTLETVRIRDAEATEGRARMWLHDYDEYPAGHFRRFP